jgi:hypothetical protein
MLLYAIVNNNDKAAGLMLVGAMPDASAKQVSQTTAIVSAIVAQNEGDAEGSEEAVSENQVIQ